MLPTEQGKATIQLKYGGKRFNRFHAQIISNNNRKRMKIFASYFAVIAKKLQLKPPKAAISV